MTTHYKTDEEVRKEFDNKFSVCNDGYESTDIIINPDDVKDFLSSIRREDREKQANDLEVEYAIKCAKHEAEAYKVAREAVIASIVEKIEGMKYDHVRMKKNLEHEKDEYWCCCECLEDQFKNSALADVLSLLEHKE